MTIHHEHTHSSMRQLMSIIFISSILLYFIFAPAVNMLFYAGDDFRYAFGGYGKACRLDDGFEFMLTLGRPVQAYLDCLSYQFAFTMERMRIIRIIAVFLMGCGMGLFAIWLHQLRFRWSEALLAAGILFLLRSLFADTIPTGALSLPFAVLLTLLAYQQMQYAHSLKNKIKPLILAALLILCSMLTYPAMSFFFPVLILTKILFSNLNEWIKTRREVIKEALLFCVIAAIYFLWATYNMHYHPQAPVPDAYRVDHPNFNIIELIKRLAMIGNVFNSNWVLFSFGDVWLQGWMTLVLVPLGIICAISQFIKSKFYLANKSKALATLGQAFFVATILFCLSSTFFLILPNLSLVELRILFGVLAARLVILFWSVKQINAWFSIKLRRDDIKNYIITFIFTVLFLYAAVQANIQVTIAALTFGEYYHHIETSLAKYLTNNGALQRVHFIWSKQEGTYSGFFVTNAAMKRLYPLQQIALKWCSLPRGVPGEEKEHQQEMMACIKSLPNNTIAVTYSYVGEPFLKSSNMLVMNLSNEKENYYHHFLKLYRINAWEANMQP